MTSPPRVLLTGYYGRGNFGDDILLKTTYGIMRQRLPEAHISVSIGRHGGDYVRTMLGDVTLIRPDENHHFDLIMHGGGGVFFDFERYGMAHRLYERFTHALGIRFFIKAEQAWRNISRTTADMRLGMGIGVGTFNPGSARLREKLPVLLDMKAMWVRDAQSLENLKRFDSLMNTHLLKGSDLAFLTEHWMPPLLRTPSPSRPRLGIILRDQREEKGSLFPAALSSLLERLAQRYDITGFIFDGLYDRKMQAALSPYPTHIWNPEVTGIADYISHLGAQDVLLSSRAHGTICGACAGVPSVIVAIEPKLQQVHEMLPNCTRLVEPRQLEHWEPAIEAMLTIDSARIAFDVQQNRLSSEQALEQISPWFAP